METDIPETIISCKICRKQIGITQRPLYLANDLSNMFKTNEFFELESLNEGFATELVYSAADGFVYQKLSCCFVEFGVKVIASDHADGIESVGCLWVVYF